jgi:hypothetical protein
VQFAIRTLIYDNQVLKHTNVHTKTLMSSGKIFTDAPLWDDLLNEEFGTLPFKGAATAFWTVRVPRNVAELVDKYFQHGDLGRGCFCKAVSFVPDGKVVIMAWPCDSFRRVRVTNGPMALEWLLDDLRCVRRRPALPVTDGGVNPSDRSAVDGCNPSTKCVAEGNP